MPTMVMTKPARIRVRWGAAWRAARRPSDETRMPTVAAVKMTPVWIAL